MRRRDALRAGAAALGAGVLGAGRAAAHPGYYRPYAEVPLEGAKEAVVSDDGTTAFVATTTGYAAVDVGTYDDPTVLADRRRPLADRDGGPLRGIYDVKQEGGTLLVVGPANPLGDALQGVLVVDVSDPANPEEVSVFETEYPIHNCYLRDGYAYLTANDGRRNPLVVVDVSGSEPAEVGRWSLVDHDARWSEVPATLRTVHDVYVRDDVAYLVQWDAGTWLLDVSDPSNPTYLTQFRGRPVEELAAVERGGARRASLIPPGNDHFVTLNEDGSLLGVGMESWAVGDGDGGLVGGPSGIDLYDATDRTNPEKLATIEPPATDRPTMGGVWTTAHNFEFRNGTLYTSWYQGGVKLYDLSDPTDPQEYAWWRRPESARFWTARAARPGEAYVASDMGSDRAGTDASLYVFPDHAGQQRDPPSLAAGNGSGGSASRGVDIATATPGGTGTGATGGDGGSTVGAPGFGVGSGLAALGVGAWRYRRRTRRERIEGDRIDDGRGESERAEGERLGDGPSGPRD